MAKSLSEILAHAGQDASLDPRVTEALAESLKAFDVAVKGLGGAMRGLSGAIDAVVGRIEAQDDASKKAGSAQASLTEKVISLGGAFGRLGNIVETVAALLFSLNQAKKLVAPRAPSKVTPEAMAEVRALEGRLNDSGHHVRIHRRGDQMMMQNVAQVVTPAAPPPIPPKATAQGPAGPRYGPQPPGAQFKSGPFPVPQPEDTGKPIWARHAQPVVAESLGTKDPFEATSKGKAKGKDTTATATAASAASAGLGTLAKVAGLAAGAMIAIPSIVRPFVEAFAPTSIAVFDEALRDVRATIGQAFLPVFETLTDVLRDSAGIIDPLFKGLQPIVQQLSKQMGSSLLSIVKLVSTAFEALLPVLQVMADVSAATTDMFVGALSVLTSAVRATAPVIEMLLMPLKPLVAAFQVFGKVMLGVSQIMEAVGRITWALAKSAQDALEAALAPLLGELPKLADIFQAVKTAFQQATRAVVLFAATVGKAFGADNFLKRLQEAFKPREAVGEKAAPKDVQFRTLEDIMRESTIRASQATGSTGEDRDTNDFLAEISADIQAIRDGQMLFPWAKDVEQLVQRVNRYLDSIPSLRTPDWVERAATDNIFTRSYERLTERLMP